MSYVSHNIEMYLNSDNIDADDRIFNILAISKDIKGRECVLNYIYNLNKNKLNKDVA